MPLKNLTPLLLVGCTFNDVDLSEEIKGRCESELVALESSCDAWNGTFGKAVTDARECIGEEVKILCQNVGYGEPHILTVKTL